ncbi:MAG TPA: permease prefix domain 2-containing transporter [Haliscomenobacter sp.]|uniref:ABC transporter permease n=1 Tax=Haliscomenobacter sp. TaxID=2717303 RepID=UPI002C5191DF|nr:ABC transporter permease [Haliscomenobacter sp.]HOY17825.1 permease prefix domain 2-containing transporter [Haliscomenobacter sp.]
MSRLEQPTPQPPRWADRLLEWFCAPHLLENVQGDLHEEFFYQVEQIGVQKAKFQYILEVLGFIKPFAIKRKPSPYPSSTTTFHPTMIRNYFNIAIRNLAKNRLYAALNIFGLTIGTLCCLYILLYVQDERSYDKHHTAAERLYRVTTELNFPDTKDPHRMSTCSPPIVPAMQAEFPEVESSTRVVDPAPFGVDRYLFKVGDKVFYQNTGYVVDSTFFQTFDYHFLAGNPKKALNAPQSMVISEALAIKLFNTTDALNKTLKVTGQVEEETYRVTGVFNNSLGKSHLMPDFFTPMNSRGIGEYVRSDNSWAGNNFLFGYLKFKPGTDVQAFEAKLAAFIERNGGDQLRQMKMQKKLFLQPVRAIHTSAEDLAMSKGTSERFLNMLLLIAGFIQLVACINFMNLSTARSTRRAKEVGVRKAVGAGRSSLMGQFLSESMLMTLIAVGLAVPLVWLLLPLLNQITGASLSLQLTQDWSTWGIIVSLVLLTGVIAGSYPAFYLSSFNPLSIFRGMRDTKTSRGAINFRKVLVVSQFVISSVLIIGAVVIQRQLNYLLKEDMGFEKNQKVIFPIRAEGSRPQIGSFRNQLRALPEVNNVSGMTAYPGRFVPNDISMYKEGESMNSATVIRFAFTDEHFVNTLKVKLLAGRNFTPQDTSSDFSKAKVLVNQTVLKTMNISQEEAIGMVLRSDREGGEQIQYTIIGVFQDINFERMSEEIKPYMVRIASPQDLPQVIADVTTQDYPAFVQKAQKIWTELFPGAPFEYLFLDQEVAQLYQAEQTFSDIIGTFTLVAIFISCLGLFGLSVFAAEQRMKEIGIRKVLGASVGSLTGLLAKDFVILVVLSICIASPIAWYLMNLWLKDFAYRIQIEWWIFVLAGGIAVMVAFLTVSFQSVRSALANPVKSLRSE